MTCLKIQSKLCRVTGTPSHFIANKIRDCNILSEPSLNKIKSPRADFKIINFISAPEVPNHVRRCYEVKIRWILTLDICPRFGAFDHRLGDFSLIQSAFP